MTVAGNGRLRRAGVVGFDICAVAGLYYASGKLGLLQELVRGQVTPLWPPTGVALAALLILGLRVWPGIALGAFLINISLGPSAPALLAIMTGNTLAPLVSYGLLRRADFRTEMNRFRDALALVFLGAFTGMLVSATVGTISLDLAGALPGGGFWPTWWVWWTGDAMGVLVIAPVLLVLRSGRRPRDVTPARWLEGSLLVAATIGVGVLEIVPAPLIFLAFPLLTWAAFRFQRAGAVPCALVVCTFAVLAATRGSGSFEGHSLLVKMISLQAFNAAAVLTALLLAATVTERNQTQASIEQAVEQLSAMVARTALHTSDPPAHPGGRSGEEDDGGQTPRPP